MFAQAALFRIPNPQNPHVFSVRSFGKGERNFTVLDAGLAAFGRYIDGFSSQKVLSALNRSSVSEQIQDITHFFNYVRITLADGACFYLQPDDTCLLTRDELVDILSPENYRRTPLSTHQAAGIA